MTREESLTIVRMILTHWRGKDWSKEEIDAYARSIQDMDAGLTTSAIARAAKEIKYRPPISELREYVRAERNRLAPAVRAPEPAAPSALPLWVKRWICARMLYKQFGRERDLRRFPEQGDFGDLTKEVMPENEWLEEANSMSDEEFRKAFQRTMWS